MNNRSKNRKAKSHKSALPPGSSPRPSSQEELSYSHLIPPQILKHTISSLSLDFPQPSAHCYELDLREGNTIWLAFFTWDLTVGIVSLSTFYRLKDFKTLFIFLHETVQYDFKNKQINKTTNQNNHLGKIYLPFIKLKVLATGITHKYMP